MPAEFPKLDIEDPADLEHVVAAVRVHTAGLVPALMAASKDRPQEDWVQSTLENTIEQWARSARSKLEPNVLVNGMSFAEHARQANAVEPFDEALSDRLQTLSETADALTEKAVSARKALPAERDAALERRAKVLAALEDRRSETWAEQEQAAAERMLPELKLKLERKEQVSQTFDKALAEIITLQTALPERIKAAQDQSRLVKRMRTMPP